MAAVLSQRSCLSTAVQAAKKPVLSASRSIAVVPSRRSLRRQTVTYAVEEQKDQQASAPQPEIAKFADNIGLPTEEGLFGFKPFPEVWVGRLAMSGFVTSCVIEFMTGKGTLQQLGLYTPNDALFYTVLAVSTGASVFAFGRTLSRALTGNMSKTELKRYGRALGLSNEASQISETETEMKSNWKGKPDTPPSGLTGSASSNPTDTFQNESAQSPAKPMPLPEDTKFVEPSERYARNVEIQNGLSSAWESCHDRFPGHNSNRGSDRQGHLVPGAVVPQAGQHSGACIRLLDLQSRTQAVDQCFRPGQTIQQGVLSLRKMLRCWRQPAVEAVSQISMIISLLIMQSLSWNKGSQPK